jgi:hypothetical protein
VQHLRNLNSGTMLPIFQIPCFCGHTEYLPAGIDNFHIDDFCFLPAWRPCFTVIGRLTIRPAPFIRILSY